MATAAESDNSVKQNVSIDKKHDTILSKRSNSVDSENSSHLIEALKEGPKKGLVQLKNSFRTLSAAPKRIVEKDKNEPSRFLGEGVSYKAKLIGILEVSEARGDRMCQDALADLKMAIRAAGEHKQRITINIAIDGLRLRDEKNGDCLYHHPVHKISFIAQDITDSRAFGYIFGSPDTGHRFFGIKTDKAASQVVITMRDLFQVVFELKKKEIETAKQHLEEHQIKLVSYPSSCSKNIIIDANRMKTIRENDTGRKHEASTSSSKSIVSTSDPVADLLGLQDELSSIQEGISQMEKLTPSDPFGPSSIVKEDPFGDSFSPPPVTSPQPAKLPPPPSKLDQSDSSVLNVKSSISKMQPDKHWFDKETEDLFESSEFTSVTSSTTGTVATKTTTSSVSSVKEEETIKEDLSVTSKSPPKSSKLIDVFTELDPLGTGRSKPYVDKKDFFQDLKNPPKKVLKDLVSELPSDVIKQFEGNVDASSTISVSETKPLATNNAPGKSISSGFQSNSLFEDPFDKSDPFEDNCKKASGFVLFTSENNDPFDNFADFSSFNETAETKSSLKSQSSLYSNDSQSGPLRVTLPPEKQLSDSHFSSTKSRYSHTSKQSHSSCLVKIPSPKQKSRSRLSKQSTLESTEKPKNDKICETIIQKSRTSDTSSPTGFTALVEDDAKMKETAPEPPPRPASNLTFIKPPPLPPKKQQNMSLMKPPPRPPYSDLSHYDYIENYGTSASVAPPSLEDKKSPPVPVPARRRCGHDRLNRYLNSKQGPNQSSDYYLTPFPLLPPPLKKSSSNKTNAGSPNPKASLDITLSQLTASGFSELAEWLNLSPVELSKMTMQELFTLLSHVSSNQSEETGGNAQNFNDKAKNDEDSTNRKPAESPFKSNQFSSTSKPVENQSTFVADFDGKFSNVSQPEDPFQDDTLFDKYAVFRELLEQENTKEATRVNSAQVDSKVVKSDEEKESSLKKEFAVLETQSSKPLSEDRYAALRDIFMEETDKQDGSDRDESFSEPNMGQGEEHMDLLALSRQQSESTESPSATIREPQSIMETTIMEEDIIDDDENDDVQDDEEDGILCVDVEVKTSKEMPLSYPSRPALSPPSPLSSPPRSILSPSNSKKPPHISVKSDKTISFSDENFKKSLEELKISKDSSTFDSAWEKFNVKDQEYNDSSPCNKSISPWSVDTDDGSKRSRSPSRKSDTNPKQWKSRRHKNSRNWMEDEESDVIDRGSSSRDESPWRQNGWSNGDETSTYHQDRYSRKDRRRRAYPRRMHSKERWDEDWDFNDDDRQSRSKYRSSSRDEERRKAEFDSRKKRSSPWSGKPDKRSSRESLNHEEERYQKKSFGDRRRKRWEEHSYPRSDRKSSYYYRDRSQESPWDDEFSEPEDDESPRAHSRKQNRRSRRHYYEESEEEYERRPRKPYSHDEQSESEAEYSQARKFQTLQLKKVSKSRRRNQSSPFEDEFNPHSFSFPSGSRSSNVGSDHSENKLSPRQDFSCTSSEMGSFKWKEDRPSIRYSKSDKMSDEGEEFVRGRVQKPSSQKQSLFEDNFTPPDTRRCSGRSVSSDVSRDDDVKNGDDVFLSGSETSVQNISNLRNKLSDTSTKRACEKLEKKVTKISSSSEIQPEDLRKKRLGRQGSIELKSRISQLRNQNESLSSLKKSDSINIFARSNDPFDDDDFFNVEVTHATIEEEESSDRLEEEKNADVFKWTQDFNSFNFSDENK